LGCRPAAWPVTTSWKQQSQSSCTISQTRSRVRATCSRSARGWPG
jgi:hypothetical protein